MATFNQIDRARNRKLPLVERLRELFAYDPVSGLLTRRIRAGGEIVGSVVGTKNSNGYLICRVDYQIHYVHRLVWAIHYGQHPPELIDHIDSDRSRNAIANLRTADFSENGRNKARSKANTSGIKGVSYAQANGKWKATIIHRRRPIFLGYFPRKDDAAAAYRDAARRYHRDYANHD